MTKRIVVREPSGLWRIIGWLDETDGTMPPDVIVREGFPPLDLIQVKPRYVLYIEPMALAMGRLGDFHPEQR